MSPKSRRAECCTEGRASLWSLHILHPRHALLTNPHVVSRAAAALGLLLRHRERASEGQGRAGTMDEPVGATPSQSPPASTDLADCTFPFDYKLPLGLNLGKPVI